MNSGHHSWDMTLSGSLSACHGRTELTSAFSKMPLAMFCLGRSSTGPKSLSSAKVSGRIRWRTARSVTKHSTTYGNSYRNGSIRPSIRSINREEALWWIKSRKMKDVTPGNPAGKIFESDGQPFRKAFQELPLHTRYNFIEGASLSSGTTHRARLEKYFKK